MAGNGHGHKTCTFRLMMGYQIDILMTGIDHRLQNIVQVIDIGILIHMEVAGLRLEDRIGRYAIPDRRANHDLLFLFQLPQAAGNYQSICATGCVLGVVFHSADGDHKRYFTVDGILDLVIKHFQHLHNSYLL